VFPRKQRPEQRINAAVALIMVLGRAMAAMPERSAYEERGIIYI
jgi:hypothetical protein